MATPEAGEWQLEACMTCGGLVFARYDEDGTPEYKPVSPTPEGETLEQMRAMQDKVEGTASLVMMEYHSRAVVEGEEAAMKWLEGKGPDDPT